MGAETGLFGALVSLQPHLLPILQRRCLLRFRQLSSNPGFSAALFLLHSPLTRVQPRSLPPWIRAEKRLEADSLPNLRLRKMPLFLDHGILVVSHFRGLAQILAESAFQVEPFVESFLESASILVWRGGRIRPESARLLSL